MFLVSFLEPSISDFMRKIQEEGQKHIEKATEYIELSLYRKDLWNPQQKIDDITEELKKCEMTYKTQQRESYLVRKSKNFKNKIEEMVDGQFNCLDMEIWSTF